MKLKKEAFILELASNVYPFDYERLKDVRFLIAKGVPSKTSKKSAANVILYTIQIIKTP